MRFKLLGLQVTFSLAAGVAFLGLALVAALLAGWQLELTAGPALLAGVLSALVFFISDLLHQLGHALAARRVGHPMVGIHFFHLLSGSVYPRSEPALPPGAHIRRALGGFWVNLVLGALFLPVALALYPRGTELLPPGPSVVAWVAAFGAFTNILILGLGALVPLKLPGGGWTDGGTLLYYWREAQARK
jgi:hypothetical protein